VKVVGKKRIQHILVGTALACALLFFLAHRVMVRTPGVLETFSSYCVYPVLLLQRSLVSPLHKRIARTQDYKKLQEKVALLEQEREDLLSSITTLEAASHFYKETKIISSFKKRYQTSHATLVQVMMKHISEHEQSLLVDAGSRHGIQKDMAAVYKKNLVGRVVEVYPYHSKILLITDNQCTVSCYCSTTKTKGIFQGLNQSKEAHLTHVDRLRNVKTEENLISSGEGIIFPAGFSVGKITSQKPDGMHLKITVQPLIDVTQLDYFYLIQKSAETALT